MKIDPVRGTDPPGGPDVGGIVMIVLAVLLLVLVVVAVVLIAVAGAGQTVDLRWEAVNLAFQPNAFVLFLLGAGVMLITLLALWLLTRGSRRQAEKRRELKRLREAERENASAQESSSRDRDDRATHEHRSGGEPSTSRQAGDHGGATSTRPVAPGDPGQGHDDAWYDTPPERR